MSIVEFFEDAHLLPSEIYLRRAITTNQKCTQAIFVEQTVGTSLDNFRRYSFYKLCREFPKSKNLLFLDY